MNTPATIAHVSPGVAAYIRRRILTAGGDPTRYDFARVRAQVARQLIRGATVDEAWKASLGRELAASAPLVPTLLLAARLRVAAVSP